MNTNTFIKDILKKDNLDYLDIAIICNDHLNKEIHELNFINVIKNDIDFITNYENDIDIILNSIRYAILENYTITFIRGPNCFVLVLYLFFKHIFNSLLNHIFNTKKIKDILIDILNIYNKIFIIEKFHNHNNE